MLAESLTALRLLLQETKKENRCENLTWTCDVYMMFSLTSQVACVFNANNIYFRVWGMCLLFKMWILWLCSHHLIQCANADGNMENTKICWSTGWDMKKFNIDFHSNPVSLHFSTENKTFSSNNLLRDWMGEKLHMRVLYSLEISEVFTSNKKKYQKEQQIRCVCWMFTAI